MDDGHEDPQALGRRLLQAIASRTIKEVLKQLAQELAGVASPRPGDPLGQDVLFAAGEQRSGAPEG